VVSGDAFFSDDGSGLFTATDYTRGPWSSEHQHAGPPAALLARAIEATLPEELAMQVVRLTIEILRPVPIATLAVATETSHPGRRVRFVEATLTDETSGKVCLRARALAIRVADLPVPPVADTGTSPLPPAQARAFEFPFFAEGNGYHRAMETRIARGEWSKGPVAAWMRMRVALVAGEAPSPLQRVVAAADSGNGVSVTLDLERFTFMNPDLTVYLHRMPVGEWVCLDAATTPEQTGIGLADTRLHDADGPIGRSDQALIIQQR